MVCVRCISSLIARNSTSLSAAAGSFLSSVGDVVVVDFVVDEFVVDDVVVEVVGADVLDVVDVSGVVEFFDVVVDVLDDAERLDVFGGSEVDVAVEEDVDLEAAALEAASVVDFPAG